ncbi:MAG TPA: DMT family transporter [Actinomycetota bacterium]|jgi:drug/metabolite transporter (DMT)-like permease|nr:DMT family transporter [Actinomycetota bacterium]
MSRDAVGTSRRLDLGFLLFATPLLWGLTFPGAKVALETLPLLPFMAWSRGLGFLTILAALPFVARRELTARSLRAVAGPGLALGGLMFVGYWLQTWGLQLTTATNSGFITGLYVVMTPLLGLALWGQRVPAVGWAAAGLAVVGLGLLAMRGFEDPRPHAGDLLVLAGAVAWAAHIALLGRLAPRHPGRLLSLAQMGVAAGMHVAACAGTGLRLHEAAEVWHLLVLTGVLGSGVAFTIQVVAQREVSAARAAIVLAGESLVSAAASAVWLGERLAPHRWVGAALIVAAMVASEVGARRRPEERLDPAAIP